MKKIVLFLMLLLLLSCNNTKEDEPKEPEKEKYYELWFYPSNYYDLTLYFFNADKAYTLYSSMEYEPVKIYVPMNKENREVFTLYSYDGSHIRIFGQSKYYEIRGMKENERYRINCIDKIGEIVEENVESIDIDIKCISNYK